jgi:hypothetical protein
MFATGTQDSFSMDLCERPHLAVFQDLERQTCRLETSVKRVTAPPAEGARTLRYTGMSLAALAYKSSMVAVAPVHGARKRGGVVLAVQVPGVLEGRPAVVFGSRVHIAYEVLLTCGDDWVVAGGRAARRLLLQCYKSRSTILHRRCKHSSV